MDTGKKEKKKNQPSKISTGFLSSDNPIRGPAFAHQHGAG
jgi:hypothetical protein